MTTRSIPFIEDELLAMFQSALNVVHQVIVRLWWAASRPKDPDRPVDAPIPLFGGGSDRRPPMPPELKQVSKEELRDICEAGTAFAIRRSWTPSEAQTLVNDTITLLCTTRRWDPTQSPLLPWFFTCLKSVINHHNRDTTKEAKDQRKYEKEQQSLEAARARSPEDDLLERESATARQKTLDAKLAMLRKRLAKHPLALDVLRLWLEDLTPAEMAKELGLPDATKVHRACEMIQYHLKAMRKKGDADDET